MEPAAEREPPGQGEGAARAAPDAAADLPDRIDQALEALWRGDSGVFSRLMSESDVGESPEEPGSERICEDPAPAETDAATTIAPDAAIPGYTILREVGRGGMGVVYQALQQGTKRIVAVKVMMAGPFASESIRRRFEREIELAARLRHPNVVRIFESKQLPSGQQYYAMEYVDGAPLDRYVEREPTDIPRILQMFLVLCEALGHAHEQGVIHRDLKPANVLVDDAGMPHILDFGLAKAIDEAQTETLSTAVSSPGQVLGTLPFLSPEQAAGRSDQIDERTDVYAVGIMLYHALTGGVPFDPAGRPSEVIERILDKPPVRPSSVCPRIDSDLETVILKALEKDRDCRYQSARRLRDDLARYLAGDPIVARRPSGLYRARKRLWKHRRPITIASVLLVLIGALAITGLWQWRERQVKAHEQHWHAAERQLAVVVQNSLDVGRIEHAQAEAQVLFSEYPEKPLAVLVWARSKFRLGMRTGDLSVTEGALAELTRRLEDERAHWSFALLLAEMYDATGDKRAESLRAQAEREMPDTADAWFLRSFAVLDQHAALDCLKEALARDREFRLAWERCAHFACHIKEYDQAMQAARWLDPTDDSNIWTTFKAEIDMRQGRFDKVIERCSRVLQRSDARPYETLSLKACAHLCLKQYTDAIQAYHRADRVNDNELTWTPYRMATPLWIVGALEDAETAYLRHREMRAFPDYSEARLFLIRREQAEIAAARGRTTESNRILADAEQQLRTACTGVPPGSWLQQIFLCLLGERAPEQLVANAQSMDLAARSEAYYYAGEACLLDRRADDARDWFLKCRTTELRFDPDSTSLDPMSEYHLAVWRLDWLEAGSRRPDTVTPTETDPDATAG